MQSESTGPTAHLLDRARDLGVATLYEAGGQVGALPREIKPVAPGMTLAGPAFPVTCPPGDNLFIHRAVATAERGDVLVIDVGSQFDCGYIGDILATAAQQRGLRGIVINGCVRDRDGLAELGLPVFARGLSVLGTTKRPDGRGALRAPLHWGGTGIAHGDVVVADSDGAVCLASALVEEVVAAGTRRAEHEERVLEQLAAGQTTLEIYDLPGR